MCFITSLENPAMTPKLVVLGTIILVAGCVPRTYTSAELATMACEGFHACPTASDEELRNNRYDDEHAEAQRELKDKFPRYVSDGHCGNIPADGAAGVGHNYFWVDRCELQAASEQDHKAKEAAEAKKQKALAKQAQARSQAEWKARMAKGQPAIGMTQDQVRNTSWGSTLSRHLTETRSHRYEQWVYDNGF